MNNEIKEILDILKNCKDYDDEVFLIKQHSATLLLDYITNLQQKIEQYENPDDMTLFYMWLDVKAKDKIKDLQQENEKLQERFDSLMEAHKICDEENEELNEVNENLLRYVSELILYIDDYKSRCEKAIEYIKYNDSDLYTFEPDYDYEENLVDNYEPSSFSEDLLNILQNGSEEK